MVSVVSILRRRSTTHLDDWVDDQDESRSDSAPETGGTIFLHDSSDGVHGGQLDPLGRHVRGVPIGFRDDDGVSGLCGLYRPDGIRSEGCD